MELLLAALRSALSGAGVDVLEFKSAHCLVRWWLFGSRSASATFSACPTSLGANRRIVAEAKCQQLKWLLLNYHLDTLTVVPCIFFSRTTVVGVSGSLP